MKGADVEDLEGGDVVAEGVEVVVSVVDEAGEAAEGEEEDRSTKHTHSHTNIHTHMHTPPLFFSTFTFEKFYILN